MKCAGARRVMLEADLAELTPQADTELGAHLRSCASCRGAAEDIRGLEAGVAAWLRATAPGTDDSSAIARAAATARHRAGTRRMTRRIGAGLSLAAAAVLAGVLILPSRREPIGPPLAAYPGVPARSFSVVAAPGHDIMVLQPADPNIVVVWYLPNRRSS